MNLNIVVAKGNNEYSTAARKTNVPLFSITKSHCCSLNVAFSKKYLKKDAECLYYKIGELNKEYFLILSRERFDGCLVLIKTKHTIAYHTVSHRIFRLLGKKNTNTRYSLKRVTNSGLIIFKLEKVIEDAVNSLPFGIKPVISK